MPRSGVDAPLESLEERVRMLERAEGRDSRLVTVVAVAVAISLSVAVLAALFSGPIAERVSARPVLTAILATGLLLMAIVVAVALPIIHRIGERGESLRVDVADLARRLREPVDPG
jgi:MFS family permease